MSRASLIEARGVFKSFGQTPALRGADVTVGQGVISVTLPPLRRMTAPSTIRFE